LRQATCRLQQATGTKVSFMQINKTHKKLLIDMGIQEKDFSLFDGKTVTYEYDAKKGVRIYDPYYSTSYAEYIDVDGWSSWSEEQDSFTADILHEAKAEAERREKLSPKPTQEELSHSLKVKFGKQGS
jgi:hypothetical protein